MVKQTKAAMTEEQQTEHDSDYQSLLALYTQLLKSLHNDDKEEALYALAELRNQLKLTLSPGSAVNLTPGMNLTVDIVTAGSGSKAVEVPIRSVFRSEERRVGKECGS